MPEEKVYPYGVIVCDDPDNNLTVEVPIALVAEISWIGRGKQKSQVIHCPRCLEYHTHGADDGYQDGFRTPHCRRGHEDRGEIYTLCADYLPIYGEWRVRDPQGKWVWEK